LRSTLVASQVVAARRLLSDLSTILFSIPTATRSAIPTASPPSSIIDLMNSTSGRLLLDPKVIENPYPFYRHLQARAPVWQVPDTEVFVVSSFALLAEAAARVEDFSSNVHCLLYRDESGLPSRLQFGESSIQTLATADPPLHTMHRTTVFPNFVAKRMALLELEIGDLAKLFVARAVAKRNVDFMAEVANMVPITVVSRLIGFRNSDVNRLLSAAFDSTEMVGATLSHKRLIELISRSNNLAVWIADQLAIAANEPGEDILTSIERGVESGALSVPESIIILQTLLAAGGESTTSLIGNAVHLLAENPDLQERLRQHPELVPNFVEEALRLESPFRQHMRSVPKGHIARWCKYSCWRNGPAFLERCQPRSLCVRTPR
jgi:cytochrome P450